MLAPCVSGVLDALPPESPLCMSLRTTSPESSTQGERGILTATNEERTVIRCCNGLSVDHMTSRNFLRRLVATGRLVLLDIELQAGFFEMCSYRFVLPQLRVLCVVIRDGANDMGETGDGVLDCPALRTLAFERASGVRSVDITRAAVEGFIEDALKTTDGTTLDIILRDTRSSAASPGRGQAAFIGCGWPEKHERRSVRGNVQRTFSRLGRVVRLQHCAVPRSPSCPPQKATPPPTPTTPCFSSPEHADRTAHAMLWLQELQGVMELPVQDWREGDITDLSAAGVDMHIGSHLAEAEDDDDGVPVDPSELVNPPFTPGRPLALEGLAKFAAARSEAGLALSYEEHAAIRAADAAALYKTKSPNERNTAGLHTFFLGKEVLRALTFDWRTTDALSSTIVKDRETDSITLMLSIRPEFDGELLDGDLLKPVVHIPEALLSKSGQVQPHYAAAVDDIVGIFRHRIAVPHAQGFLWRLQESGHVDYPRLRCPPLSEAAAIRLGRERKPKRAAVTQTWPDAAHLSLGPPCYACEAASNQPDLPTSVITTACACSTAQKRVIALLPGALKAQCWDPERAAKIAAAIEGAYDDEDAMYAAMRSLGVCGKHAFKLLAAAVDDLEHKLPLTA
ncbi:hypothetical protein AURDEDRAFT_121980 [Auricularia subglabra TFB-10046 SS5]|nr:hypothetical protein AURDEDRAFT_121980 [Auricularia subglabra TFB-10046 SS5]